MITSCDFIKDYEVKTEVVEKYSNGQILEERNYHYEYGTFGQFGKPVNIYKSKGTWYWSNGNLKKEYFWNQNEKLTDYYLYSEDGDTEQHFTNNENEELTHYKLTNKLHDLREFEDINYYYFDNFIKYEDTWEMETENLGGLSYMMFGGDELNCKEFDCNSGILISYIRYEDRSLFGSPEGISYQKKFKFPEIYKDKFYLNSYDMKIYNHCVKNSTIPIKPYP